ncbi:MAG: hypothetical protein U0929_15040 [Planctomycetaceae bacterium]
MPRKYELTFQRGADGRSGRWKKFYRGKAHYLGAGRSKSDIESYRTALEAWKKLKVQLDAELIPVPRAYDSDYDEVIREWKLVLAWSVQHGANDEAVVAREKLVELRARREKVRQLPVTHHDRLWSRLRPAPEELQKIADIALARQGESLDAFREAMMKRSFIPMATPREASAYSINRVDPLQKAEIEWQDRLANQSKVIASADTRSLGGWVQAFLAKEQQRVNAGELSASCTTGASTTMIVRFCMPVMICCDRAWTISAEDRNRWKFCSTMTAVPSGVASELTARIAARGSPPPLSVAAPDTRTPCSIFHVASCQLSH